MKDAVWLNSIREIVFPHLEKTQFNSTWKQLQEFYAHGVSQRKSLGRLALSTKLDALLLN